jgi:hypothetical protein
MSGPGIEHWVLALGVAAFFLWPLAQEAALCFRERRARKQREREERCLRRLLGEQDEEQQVEGPLQERVPRPQS